jgi:catechol 2,3-dioxygenase-like lactoylglutathione lyase family enzyme
MIKGGAIRHARSDAPRSLPRGGEKKTPFPSGANRAKEVANIAEAATVTFTGENRRRLASMTIVLNHTIVPARDKEASARFLAHLFGLPYQSGGHFAQVRINDTLTLDFDNAQNFESHHYAFHVSDAEFDAILQRLRAAGIPYGSDWSNTDNGHLNDWRGGRGFYFHDPNGHLLELLTRT